MCSYALPEDTSQSLKAAARAIRLYKSRRLKEDQARTPFLWHQAMASCMARTAAVGTFGTIPCPPHHPLYRTHASHETWSAGGYIFCKLCGRHSSRTTRLHDQCEGYTSGAGTAAALHAFLAGKRPPGIHFWTDLSDPDSICPPHRVHIIRVNSAAVASLHSVAHKPLRQLCRLQMQPLVTSTSERARLLRLRVIAKEHRPAKSSQRRVLKRAHG